MRSMRSRTSLAASSRLVPHVNSITTELVPSLDELDTVSTPDTALTVSSMGLEISCSTSSGLASSYVVLMDIAGKVISGIRSTGRDLSATPPNITTMDAHIPINTGLLTENSGTLIMFYSPASWLFSGR